MGMMTMTDATTPLLDLGVIIGNNGLGRVGLEKCVGIIEN